MTPGEEWEREAQRAQRWERTHRAFTYVVGLAIAGAITALQLYREYLIWFR